MKLKVLLLALLASVLEVTADAADRELGPRIAFSSTIFDFGTVTCGQPVKHDFAFTNTGTAALEIMDVKPGCGCTTAGEWDRLVQPGKMGVIPLQFNSAGFGGSVTKTANVFCNDPSQSNIVLQLMGTVWKPIDISPTVVVFQPSDEDQTKQTKIVRIVSNLNEPLTLSDLECTDPSIRAELRTVNPGKEFELLVTALPPFATRNSAGSITLKTSSAQGPLLTIGASVVVQPVMAVIPQQVMIVPGPLAGSLTSFVTVINNSRRVITFSDVTVNAPGVEAGIRAPEESGGTGSVGSIRVDPGKQMTIAVSFPAGFQIPPGRKFELALKTTHPKFPFLHVPIVNMGAGLH